jgi:hypothetical protein
MWESQPLTAVRASMACTGIALPFTYLGVEVKILKILKANDRQIRQPECYYALMILYWKTENYAT